MADVSDESDCTSNSSVDLELFCEVEEEEDSLDYRESFPSTVAPYQFEPYLEDADDKNDEETGGGIAEGAVGLELQVGDGERRLENTAWCKCGKCVLMPTVEESVCCCDFEKISMKTSSQPNLNCITEHGGFEPVCLNQHVLDTAYYCYAQHYEPMTCDNNSRMRYTAYRQFVRWCWQYLGKKIRVPIPSCVVNQIRDKFPSAEYTGFNPLFTEN